MPRSWSRRGPGASEAKGSKRDGRWRSTPWTACDPTRPAAFSPSRAPVAKQAAERVTRGAGEDVEPLDGSLRIAEPVGEDEGDRPTFGQDRRHHDVLGGRRRPHDA